MYIRDLDLRPSITTPDSLMILASKLGDPAYKIKVEELAPITSKAVYSSVIVQIDLVGYQYLQPGVEKDIVFETVYLDSGNEWVDDKYFVPNVSGTYLFFGMFTLAPPPTPWTAGITISARIRNEDTGDVFAMDSDMVPIDLPETCRITKSVQCVAEVTAGHRMKMAGYQDEILPRYLNRSLSTGISSFYIYRVA